MRNFQLAEPDVKPAPVKPSVVPKRESSPHPGRRPVSPNEEPAPFPPPKAIM